MKRRQFDKEFKTTIVNLLNSSHTMKTIYEYYDLKEVNVYYWEKEFKTETGAFKYDATLAYEHEIRQLKKQSKEMILKWNAIS